MVAFPSVPASVCTALITCNAGKGSKNNQGIWGDELSLPLSDCTYEEMEKEKKLTDVCILHFKKPFLMD